MTPCYPTYQIGVSRLRSGKASVNDLTDFCANVLAELLKPKTIHIMHFAFPNYFRKRPNAGQNRLDVVLRKLCLEARDLRPVFRIEGC